MKNHYKSGHFHWIALLLISTFFITSDIHAQLSGTYFINNTHITGGQYFANFTDAIIALNNGITGPVIFNVTAGQSFTEPATLTITASGTASNTITFQKSGSGSNPLIQSSAGTANNYDGIVIIAGGDYITFDGIDLADVTPGGSNYVEWGYALLLKNGSAPFDGCQFVTIKNCKITLLQSSLPNTFTATKGIYVGNHEPGNPAGTSRTITTTTDAANNCKFYNNTIDKCYYGIYLNGYNSSAPPDLLYDQNNEIGGLIGTGNTITNFGAGASVCAGIFAQYQNNLKVNYNSINGGAGTTVAFFGIQSASGNNSNVDIIGNTVQMTSDAVSGYHYAVYNSIGSGGLSNTVNIQNNEVKGFAFNNNSSTGSFYGIYQNAAAYIVNVSGNLVHDCTIDVTAGTALFYGISTTAALTNSTHNIYSNQVYNLIKKNCPSAQITGIYYSYGSLSVHDNIVHDLLCQNTTSATTEQIMGISNSNTFTSENNYNNTVYNLSYDATNSNDISNVYGMYFTTPGVQGSRSIHNNNVYNLSNLTASVNSASSVYGIYMDGGNSGSLYQCNVYGLTCNHGNGSVLALYFGPGSSGSPSYTYNVYNNFVSDLNAPNSVSSTALVGMCFAGGTNGVIPTLNAFYNTVFLNGSTGAGALTYAAYISGQNNYLLLNNNIFVNTSNTSGGYTIALGKASPVSSNYLPGSNNNCYYAGTPSANNLLLYDGTACLTVAQLKSYLDPRDLNSVSIMPVFVNSTIKPYDLHISTGIPTQLESGGQPITSPLAVTTDYDNQTRSSTFPDIGADEFSGTKVDNTAPLLSFIPLGNAGSGSARTLYVTFTDPSGVPTSGAGLPVLYWKKNAGAYSAVTAASLGSNNYSFSFGAGTVTSDVVSYYIVTQDLVGTPNIGCYPFKGASGFTASPPAVSTPPTTPLSYTVKAGISGVITVGSGGTYATIAALFTAINNNVVTGNINAQIISNITSGETGVKLKQWIEDPPNSNYSLNIRPDAEVMRTISGGIVYNPSGSGLVSLIGAKNVSFIGDIPSPVTPGIYLTFRNTTAGGLNPPGNTFYIANGSACTISYCDIQNNFDSTVAGGSDIDVENGTNNVIINNCNIHDAVADHINIVSKAIYCNSSSMLNIFNNNIYNCCVGIYLDGVGSGGTVTGNNFYYNALSTATNSQPQAALWTGGNGLVGVGGWNISNNYIGGSAPLCGGTPWTNTSVYAPGGTSISYAFMGIGFRGNSSTLSLIQNNVIQNIAFSYGDMCGIRFSGSMTILGNIIGDPANTTKLIHGTDYGSKGTFGIYGESNSSGNYISNIENNTITNLYCCNVAGSGPGIIAGMRFEQACNVRKNKMWGFGFQSVGGSTAPTFFSLYGIYYYTFQSGASGLEISNNMISLNAVGITSPAIYGIYDANTYSSVQINYYYNTIVLYGSSNGSNNTFAFDRTSANIMTLKDNILINNITESGTGKHFAIASLDLTGNSLTSDYNDLYSVVSANLGSYPNTSSVTTPLTFAGWQSGILADSHSSNEMITTVSSNDLHLSELSIGDIKLAGTPISGITTDIDGDPRFTTPYMGADEIISSPLPVELVSFSINVQGKDVFLNWKTASEKNTNYFNIERTSVKNNVIQNDWNIEGEVKAAGTSLYTKQYTFNDKNVPAGKYAYRLKMVDLDGSYSYSNTVQSEIALPVEYKLSQNYPNPFNPSTRIDYQLPVDSRVTIEIFNITGQKIGELFNKEQSAGYYSIEFGAGSIHKELASGVYIYRMTAINKLNGNNFVNVKKMIMMK